MKWNFARRQSNVYKRGAAENIYRGIPFSRGATNRPTATINRNKALENKDAKRKKVAAVGRGQVEGALNDHARMWTESWLMHVMSTELTPQN